MGCHRVGGSRVTYPASACRLYMSTTAPSAILTRMKVKPLGVRQSALLLTECYVSVVLCNVFVPSFELDLLESTARVPLDSLKSSVRIVAQSVQAAAKWHSSAGRRPIWVIVVGI